MSYQLSTTIVFPSGFYFIYLFLIGRSGHLKRKNAVKDDFDCAKIIS